MVLELVPVPEFELLLLPMELPEGDAEPAVGELPMGEFPIGEPMAPALLEMVLRSARGSYTNSHSL